MNKLTSQSSIARSKGKKLRYWVHAGLPAATNAGTYQINTSSSGSTPFIVDGGNIQDGNVPYPMYVTSVRSQVVLDYSAITFPLAGRFAVIMGSSYFYIKKADQVQLFDWSPGDCQKLQMPIPGGTFQSISIDLTARPKLLDGDKQYFSGGDKCGVYMVLNGSFLINVDILIEINGYAV